MDCKKCGTPLEENDQFCKNCGAPVNQVSAQTNYGPAPKNGTLKFVLIFLGIAIIVAAIIIAVAVFAGDKDKDDDDDDDVRTSKKKTEIVTKDDEDEDEDEDIKVKDEDEEEEDDEVVVKPTTKSTYTVKSNGFTFKIPTDLVYETMIEEGVEVIALGDEDGTWIGTIAPIQGSYNQLSTNKSQLQSAMIQQGYTASTAVEKTYNGVPFIVIEASTSGQNALLAYAKANSMYIYSVVAMSIDNEFDYDILETISSILSTAEFNTETTNMEIVKGLDLSVISDLAKE